MKTLKHKISIWSICFLLAVVIEIQSDIYASPYKWGTVQVGLNAQDLPAGRYDIFLVTNNSEVANFSPIINQLIIPDLNGIYIRGPSNDLCSIKDSKKIVSLAESYSYIKRNSLMVINNRLPSYLIGFSQLYKYEFYDSDLNRNIFYYSTPNNWINYFALKYSERKSYYLRVIREMVYQNNSQKTDFIKERMRQTSEALKIIGAVSKLSQAAYKVYDFFRKSSEFLPQIIYFINLGDGQAIKDILQMNDEISLIEFENGTSEIIQQLESNSNLPGEPGFIKNLKNLDNALKGLSALLLAEKVGWDVISATIYWMFQKDVFADRLAILNTFFTKYNYSINNYDPAIIEAFNDFKNEYDNLQTYIINNVLTPENIREFLKLAIDFGSLLSLYGIAIWPLSDVVLEIFQDVDWIHYTIASYTFLKLIRDYLIIEYPLLESAGYINYNDAYNLISLIHIFVAQSYAVDEIFEKLTCAMWYSPADWFKFIFSFGQTEAICNLSKVYKSDALNIYRIVNNSYLWADVIFNYDFSYSQFIELPGNFQFIESNIKDKNIIAISLSPIQNTYQPNDTVILFANLNDVFETPINGADLKYNIKNNSNMVVKSGYFSPSGNGQYQVSFNAPDIPGNYIIEVTSTKVGYQDGFATANFTLNEPDPRYDAAVEDVDWVNPSSDDFQVDIGETISGNILVKNYGTVATDIPIVLEILGTNKFSTTIVPGVEPGKTKISSLFGINTTGLTSGFYTIQVRTNLSGDSNSSNNSITRNILIGQRSIIPNRLPLQSYKLYQRTYSGPLQTTPAVTISAGGLSYTITATYIDDNSSWFNISGVGSFKLFKDKLYSIDTNNDGKLDNDKLFIAVYGNYYFPKTNTYYFDFQVGIYDENTNAQQINPDRVVNRITSCIGSLSGMVERAKAKYDYYLEPGKSNYYSFLRVFNPELNQSILDGYICRWSFSNRDSSGSPVGNYGGSLYMYYPFISGGRIDDYYVIVPSPTMPSREYDLLIIQEQEIDMTGSDFFRHLGYAHSVRMCVEDYHEAEVTSILLPTSMRSGESYTVQVQIKNNGDVPENGIPVSLNITSNSGYNITMNKNSGNIPAGATQIIDFPWETLGLPSDTYTFSVLISVNGDQNTDNNSKSVQQQLLPPYSLGITGSLDKLEYGEGEVITLNVSVKDDLQNPVSGASVSYKVKKGGVEVNLSTAYDQGNGSYLVQFNAAYIPGTYLIEITASKIGYLSGFNNEIIFLVKDTIKPTIPILINPINNSNISTQEVNFDWLDSIDSASGIAAYKIQVSKRIDFSILDIDTQTIASNYSTNLIPGIYYWRVRSIDNANNQSDWSTISKFTIDIDAPSIQITSPTPNPTYSTDQPTINIKGSASDNIGVTQVTWANNRGGGGIASGTDSWEVNEITLFEGENIITVTARDAAGNINTDTLTVNFVSSSQPFPFSDDFSTDKGWIGYEMGGWERKPASAGGGENGNPDPAMDHSPTNDNYILGFAIGGDYPNGLGEEKSIISPPIDCTGQSRVFLKFWRHLNVENNSSDHARVYVSSDGTNWTQLWENPVYDLKDNQWIQVVYDISAIAANQPTVYIKFTMGPTNSSGRFSGWNIDDLEVTSEYSGPMAIYLPYANIPNPNIDEILIQKGFGITHSSSVPSDLSSYSLVILQSYDASNQTAADRIRDFVQSGGGAIIMHGCPKFLAGNTDNLTYIKEWFGASWYGNDCGYATIVKDHPFGTDLVINDKVNYCPTYKCSAAAVYGLTSDATAISQWSNKVRIDSFIHTFGQGRVFYYAGSPGYSEDPDPTLIDNGLTLFEAGLAWAAKKLVKNRIIDFDGDNKTDIGIYRKNFGAWYIKPSGGGNPYGVGWGGDLSDKPVPGDYDGDGKTDIAIYRGSNGGWYIIPSSNPGAPYGVGWGGDDSDKPVPGDYDGDRKTDIAVYRTNTGAWYIIPSSNPGAPYGVGWGGDLSDKPVPGDYDGDGKTDIAIYRESNGGWYIIPSSNPGAPYGVGWGGHSTDKPVPGDYDGDEKTDIAVYRAQFGTWFVIPSSGNNPYGLGWGGDDSDKPVPGDYDGDRKTDIAIYRGSIGAWYIYPSGGGIPYGVGWGGNLSDIPVTVNLAGLE